MGVLHGALRAAWSGSPALPWEQCTAAVVTGRLRGSEGVVAPAGAHPRLGHLCWVCVCVSGVMVVAAVGGALPSILELG